MRDLGTLSPKTLVPPLPSEKLKELENMIYLSEDYPSPLYELEEPLSISYANISGNTTALHD